MPRPRPSARSTRPTLAHVARRAGVSVSTASRVLNGYAQGFSLSPARRDAVLAAVRALGYRPDAVGSLLKSRKTLVVAVHGYVTNTRPLPSVYPVMLGHAADRLSARGCEVCARVRSSPEESFRLFPWRVDGALILATWGRERSDALEGDAIPYVVLNGPAAGHGLSVTVDEAGVLADAFDHLRGLGHRRVVYRGTERSRWPASVHARHRAFRARVAALGLPWLGGEEDDAGAVEPPDDFLRRYVDGRGATAVVAYSHVEAMSLVFAAMRLGWSIPKRFSLVCFNDVYPCEEAGLTAMALPLRQMGESAADLLWAAMTGEPLPASRALALPGELHIRGSTAAPPS